MAEDNPTRWVPSSLLLQLILWAGVLLAAAVAFRRADLLVLGLLFGMGLAFYVIWLRYGRA